MSQLVFSNFEVVAFSLDRVAEMFMPKRSNKSEPRMPVASAPLFQMTPAPGPTACPRTPFEEDAERWDGLS